MGLIIEECDKITGQQIFNGIDVFIRIEMCCHVRGRHFEQFLQSNSETFNWRRVRLENRTKIVLNIIN